MAADSDWTTLLTASRFRELLNRMIDKRVDEVRPNPRQGIVVSVDYTGRKAGIVYIGEEDPVDVQLTSVFPRLGQRVFIGGPADDRHVIEILGTPAGTGSEIVLSPGHFVPSTGSGATFGTIDQRVPALMFPDGVDAWAATTVGIPQVWTSYSIDMIWTFATGAGNVNWQLNIAYELNNAVVVTSSSSDSTVEAIRPGAIFTVTDRFTMDTNVQLFGTRALSVGRLGTDVDDTFTGSAALLGVVLYETV